MSATYAHSRVMLICMPWDMLRFPSIQLGILKNVLERAGIPTAVRQYNLALMQHFTEAGLPAEEKITLKDVIDVTQEFYSVGMGDWIFAVPPFKEPSEADDARYVEYLRAERVKEEKIQLAHRMRRLIPAFLEACVREILAEGPRVVGFTTAFSQNVASLALARLLKERDPTLKIVFGGGNCDGPMGAALHRSFPWVDVVVRGEAEAFLPELMRELLEGAPLTPQPGLCYRRDGEVHVVEQVAKRRVAMDEVPLPTYDEYFERLERSSFRDELLPQVRILYEGSRGCWWGAKSHCSFCGIRDLTYFSKSADRVLEDLLTLARKYKQLNIHCVDNIIEMGYFRELLPKLVGSGYDFRIFIETKANLKKDQVRLLRDAGMRRIQPGVESLSTPILKQIRKGVTALQNVRLLKWCAQYGITVEWNLIYGFPGEPVEEYRRMAQLARSLTHLRPPMLNRLHLDRFSPYHKQTRELGIENLGPRPHYKLLYGLDDATLMDLAYHFEYRHLDGREPDAYVAELRQVVETWNARTAQDYRALRYRTGPGFLTIVDRRTFTGPAQYNLDEVEGEIYLACDAGMTSKQLLQAVHAAGHSHIQLEYVEKFLKELLEARLLMEEEGQYLSLAIPENPDAPGTVRSSPGQAAPPPPAPLGRTG